MLDAPPRFAVVSTGTEILQGLYPDLNAQFLAARLTALGYEVAVQTAAPDFEGAIEETLRSVFPRVDMILMTGGLGPTLDDAVRPAVARLWNAPLQHDERAWRMIEERFRGRYRQVPESNRRQTQIPAGAIPLYNEHGTAPGFILEAGNGRPALAALPGPPREMQPMFLDAVAPYLARAFPIRHRQTVLEVHTAGRSESDLNERVADLFGARTDVNVALLAGGGVVKVRLTLRAESDEALAALRREMRDEIVRRIGEADVWGFDDETLAGNVGRRLKELGLTIAVAESCTGGLISAALTDVPGASAYVTRGYVVYSNEAKMELLGVKSETLAAHGAVSAETAAEMADGARRAARCDVALSVTGIAGPAGGTQEKPVGLVWFGVSTARETEAISVRFPGDRDLVRHFSTMRALDFVRRLLLREYPPGGV